MDVAVQNAAQGVKTLVLPKLENTADSGGRDAGLHGDVPAGQALPAKWGDAPVCIAVSLGRQSGILVDVHSARLWKTKVW
jgi:hypothetical protein